jgi:prepilin-type processing-associated H-X9-DG protein
MIAIADSDADGISDFVIQPERDGGVWLPGRVHGGGPNVLFCDGHVQWYRQEDITYDSRVSDEADAPRRLRVRRMWNHDHKAHVYGVE